MITTTQMKIGMTFPTHLAVFDTDTTGTDVEEARIVSAFAGIMDTATGEFTDRWTWLINPGVPIPDEAAAVHGISNERAQAEGMDPKEAIYQIMQRLNTFERDSLAIVAMNAAFDFTILDRELARHWPGLRPLMQPNDKGVVLTPVVLDPMVLDRAFDRFRKGGRKLVDLCKNYGVPVEENAHDAEADCKMAGRVAVKLLHHHKLQSMSLAEVHAKTIPTHRDNSMNVVKFWKEGKGLPDATPEERQAAIKDATARAGKWPMVPRSA